MKKIYFFLFLVILLGFILRFYQLGNVPISLHRDETVLGYNAYSILKTGRDISGIFLPIHFESFFFSPAGYSYFSIPFIALLGLSEFSIRTASVVFGVITIPLIFLITLRLFHKDKNKNLIGLYSSLILAISPWHINLSRVAVENTIVVFFICLGIFLYLTFLEKKNLLFLFLALISLSINFFIYQAPRVFLPIFIPFLAFSLNELKNIKRAKYFLALLYIILIILPVALILSSSDLSLRINSLSIFKSTATSSIIQEQSIRDHLAEVPQFISRIFHNKITGYSLTFVNNYFKHFSFEFLFSDAGFPDRFRIPQIGLIYIFELPLILLSLLKLFEKSFRQAIFLCGWVLIAFVGSALTYDDIPNMQRTLIAVPAISTLSGYGLFVFLQNLKNRKLPGKGIILVFIILAIFNFSYFLVQYFVQGKFYRTWYRQDGYRELVFEVNKLLPSYEKAIITSRESAPTIFFLFYNKYEPALFQEETKNIDMRESDHVSFGNYEFTEEECPLRIDDETGKITGEEKVLYVNSGLCKESKDFTTLVEIKRSDGSKAFKILKI